MAVWTSFGLLSLFCLFNVEAWSTYKECKVYEPGERSWFRCRFCFPSYESSFEYNKTAHSGKWTTRAYCREFSCQHISTSDCTGNEVYDSSCIGCYSCPGNCEYGGRVYKIGDIFKCLDGINKCKCINTGNVITLTNWAYGKDDLCEPIHYGACSLYETHEQKPLDKQIKRNTCVKQKINGRQKDICLEYGCLADVSCEPRWNISAGDGCLYCPGTCMYGGRIVAANSTFKCMDGVNTCACSNDGIVTPTSSVTPTINSMCKQRGKCKLYSRGEERSKGCSECRIHPSLDFAEICRDYTCATTNCSMPLTDNGCCPSCPGTCNYGGSVYKVGEKFTCVNGYDKCRCRSTGNVILNPRWFAIFPFAKVCFSD